MASGGEWWVFEEDGGALFGQFLKTEGPVSFALPPGAYRLRGRLGASPVEAHVRVASGGTVVLREQDLAPQLVAQSALKGRATVHWTLAASGLAVNAAVKGVSPLMGGEVALSRMSQRTL